MGEARTQVFVAEIVNSDTARVVRVPCVFFAFRHKDIGYIVMEYIHGRDCSPDDASEIALAVKRLLFISGPTLSVIELQEHMNNVSSALHSSRR